MLQSNIFQLSLKKDAIFLFLNKKFTNDVFHTVKNPVFIKYEQQLLCLSDCTVIFLIKTSSIAYDSTTHFG